MVFISFALYGLAKKKVGFNEEVEVKTIEAPEQLEIDEVSTGLHTYLCTSFY